MLGKFLDRYGIVEDDVVDVEDDSAGVDSITLRIMAELEMKDGS